MRPQTLILSLFLCFCLLGGSACSSARKQKEQRKRRSQAAAKTGLFCSFVPAHEDKEMDIELNLQIAKNCQPDLLPTFSQFIMDAETRGILYCCKKKDSPIAEKSDPAAEAFIESQNKKN